MDEVIFGEILRRISIIAIIVGTLTGLDLILGAKVLTAFNKVSGKKFSLDDTINNAKGRIGLGLVFLIVCSFLLLSIITNR